MKKSKKISEPRFYSLFLVLLITVLGFLAVTLIVDNTVKLMITAKISELTVTTTVRVRAVVYDIIIGCLQNSINQGDSISANITVRNMGSYQGDAEIAWWVEDSSGNSINASGSSSINILPLYSWTSIKTLYLPSSISAGTYRFKANVSAPDYYGTAHCSFEVVQPIVTTAPPSAAGGGSVGPVIQPPVTKETVSVSKILLSEEGTFNFKSPDLPVSKISVAVINTVEGVKISVTKNACGGEEGNAPGTAYQNMCIEKENIKNIDIRDVKIKFKVEKSWISKNEISLSSISLYRYSNGWNKLTTNLVDEDTNNVYFEAKAFGLSTFTITGKKIGEKKQVDIFYPSTISAFRNSTKRVYIQIKNYENEPLNNLKLILQGLELSWFKIIPSNIILNPGSTQEFAIEFTIPPDASTKTYPVNLLVKSDEFEEYVKMDIDILEILPRQKIQERMNELEEEINSLENRINELGRTGVEVVAVSRLLEVAKEKLNEVKSELQIENYGRASEIIHDIEGLLNDIRGAISTGPFRIRGLSFIAITILIVGLLALAVGRVRISLGGIKLSLLGVKVKEKKAKIGILDKIKFMFVSKTCSKCGKKMQDMYRENKLIGYRCSKCGYTKYRDD